MNGLILIDTIQKRITGINTFLVDDKYILFYSLKCDNGAEFYIAIRKIGESIIMIYKNPVYVYLEKFSDFKTAFRIKNKSDINRCFNLNNITYDEHKSIYTMDNNWDLYNYYTYA